MLLERGWCGTVEGPGTTEGRAVASAALRHKDCRLKLSVKLNYSDRNNTD
jgi:hypothetical protein